MKEKNNQKRLFLAINIPSTVRAELGTLQIQENYIKWMNPKQFHITVHFLGNVENAKISTILKIIEDVIEDYDEIKIRLGGIRVVKQAMIWIEVDDINNDLKKLQGQIAEKFKEKNIGVKSKYETYRPHILLGRFKGGSILSEDDPVLVHAKQNFSAVPLSAGSISLFESVLTDPEAKHYLIEEMLFGKVRKRIKKEQEDSGEYTI